VTVALITEAEQPTTAPTASASSPARAGRSLAGRP
jgi:hypothetical protein